MQLLLEGIQVLFLSRAFVSQYRRTGSTNIGLNSQMLVFSQMLLSQNSWHRLRRQFQALDVDCQPKPTASISVNMGPRVNPPTRSIGFPVICIFTNPIDQVGSTIFFAQICVPPS